MSTIEALLTSALSEGSDHLELPTGAARVAWKRGRRRHHQLVAVGTGVGIVAATVTAVGVARMESPGRATPTQVVTSSTPSTASTVLGSSPTCPASETIGTIPSPDPALESICLPVPAPGFPLSRGPEETTVEIGGLLSVPTLARTFLVGVTPPVKVTPPATISPPNGAIVIAPTGPEATVQVARAGAFPTEPSAVAAAHVYPVIGTANVLGAPATIVSAGGGEIGVLVSAGGFDIAAYGVAPKSEPAVTPAQLIALIESLQGLRGN